MMTKRQLRIKRKIRIRAQIKGSADRPRLVVFRSNRALFAQIINDQKGVTLVSKHQKGKNKEAGKLLGQKLAEAAKAKHIVSVVFDRGGYRYHGAVAALAEAAREGGLTL